MAKLTLCSEVENISILCKISAFLFFCVYIFEEVLEECWPKGKPRQIFLAGELEISGCGKQISWNKHH